MERRKLVVAVLMGGRSGEHDVSLRSGAAALANLPPERVDSFPVVLGQDGRWRFPEPAAPLTSEDTGLPLPEGLRALLDRKPDVAFLAMHGPQGEDGKLQSLLELVGLPYTGSDPYASSLAMNKPAAKYAYRANGIPVADDVVLSREDWRRDPAAVERDVRARFTPPWVLKTPKLGSSVGLDIVPAERDLGAAIEALFAIDDELLVEQFVRGRELTVSVLDTPALGATRALPVIEITPVDEPFFNYRAKYTVGAAREVCPAPLDAGMTARVQALGVRAHRVLGCRGFSRSDFILTSGGQLVTLETNTIPGLTETSLLPQAAAVAGISFSALVEGMVRGALGLLPAG